MNSMHAINAATDSLVTARFKSRKWQQYRLNSILRDAERRYVWRYVNVSFTLFSHLRKTYVYD